MTASDPDFLQFRDGLIRHFDWFAARGQSVPIWWRDDDAIAPTPALDRLLAIANRHGIEVALAVIPRDVQPALAERLSGETRASVLLHGYCHKNFQDKARGEKAAELGSRRDPDEAIAELRAGAGRLSGLFAERFQPVLVPPWNRIAPQIARRLPEVGVRALSTFTVFHPHAFAQVQTHIDMIKWKKDRRFIGWRSAALRFDFQLARRRTNPEEPIGILSHHLAQTDASFDFLDRVFEILGAHPGARFTRVGELIPAPAGADTGTARG